MKKKKMSAEDAKKYEELIKNAKQMELDIQSLQHEAVKVGYARVSTNKQAKDGNSLEAQEKALRDAGATIIYSDAYTGTVKDRPELDKLLQELESGDTLIVTKLDRIARSVQQGIELIEELCNRGISVQVLNLGILDSSPTGKLIRNVMLSFAEFERDMILQRTREGKEVAKEKPGYKEGRPKKYSKEQINLAVELLDTHSYTKVTEMTGISRATLIRAKAYANKFIEQSLKKD